METNTSLSLNTILLVLIAVASIITAISTFIIAKNSVNRKLLQVGIAFLLEKNYSEAINKFDELSKKSLSNNKGLYYKAFALLTRDEDGDKTTAIKIMNEIVEKNLGCKEHAREYLSRM